MVSSKVKYSTIGVALVLFSGLLSVMFASDPLFAQGSNQTAGNRTGEAMQTAGNRTGEGLQTAGNQTGEALQTAGNETGEALQTAGNRTGEGLQAVANETGELLGNASKGVQEFFNQGGENQSG
ncbi:MAG: hypothetical protein WCD28_10010 [Nitrososphaeraceae archaeon]